MANDRFRMLAYSGAVVERGWWGRLVIDISGIRADNRLPALREHMRDRPAGVIDRTAKNGKEFTAEGYFLDSRDGRECRALLKEGYPMQASFGVYPEVIEEVKSDVKATVNGETFLGPGVIWRQSHVREISFVSLGADSKTSVSSLAASAPGGSPGGPSFLARVDGHMSKGLPRGKALQLAAREDEAGHRAWVEAGCPSFNAPETAPGSFEAAVALYVDQGKKRSQALSLAAKNHPELHEEYLTRSNEDHRRRLAESRGR